MYEKGDFVFAKVRGFAAWPAVIDSVKIYKNNSKVYNVIFYGTQQKGVCRINDLVTYDEESKEKFSAGKNVKSPSFLLAVKEIEKDIKAKKRNSIRSSMNNSSNSSFKLPATTTPSAELNNTNDDDSSLDLLTNCDKAVNTPQEFDLVFQRDSLINKCIDLEKSLMDREKDISVYTCEDEPHIDFQNRILIQELKTYKEENSSLKEVINILRVEKEALEFEIRQLTTGTTGACLHCFPLIKRKEASFDNDWKQVRSHNKSINKKSTNIVEANPPLNCTNNFQALVEEDNEGRTNSSVLLRKPSEVSEVSPIKKASSKNKNTLTQDRNRFNYKTTDKLGKLVIVADSQGKDLAFYVQQLVKDKWNVFGMVQPGAPLEAVMESAKEEVTHDNLSTSDCLLIIAGTNNVSNNHLRQHQLTPIQVRQYIQSQITHFNQTNLILATIPYRYDKAENSRENQLIKNINSEIRRLAYSKQNVHLIDLYILERCHHTRHGLHISRRGKKHLAKLTVDLANSMVSDLKIHSLSPVRPLGPVTHPSTSLTCHEPHTLSVEEQESSEVSTMAIVEANMTSVLDQCRSEETTGFAHCVSRDFQMPADNIQQEDSVLMTVTETGTPSSIQTTRNILAWSPETVVDSSLDEISEDLSIKNLNYKPTMKIS